jgi:hypothetical protein
MISFRISYVHSKLIKPVLTRLAGLVGWLVSARH